MTGLWMSRVAPVAGLGAAVAAVIAVLLFVDLSPRVEGDFFFAEDDPQMEASREVARRFPLASQMVVRVADSGLMPEVGLEDPAYLQEVAALAEDLRAVPGVERAYSVATEDPSSPLFRRILLTPDPAATNVVLQVGEDADPELLLPRIEAVMAQHEGPDVDLVVSGVPAIVEMIRRSLFRDLVVFSLAAVLVFALLMTAIYRDTAVVVGTLATCLTAVAVTLLLVQAMDVGIGLLTANLVTIVFVLTLSHVVFLTGNWRRVAREGEWSREGRKRLLDRAVRDTVEGSFWAMATTLLGFASLLSASARPLRELGTAGVTGSVAAMVVAYLVFPAFLGSWAQAGQDEGSARPDEESARPDEESVRRTGRRPLLGAGRWVLPVAAALVAFMTVGLLRLDTDPGLLTYFEEGSELRQGLARIDEDGGSSTLDVVVADPAGRPVSAPEAFQSLQQLQAAFEADSAVGVVLSPTVLIEHARTVPLAGLLPVGMLLDIASSEALDGVGRAFVTPDRSEARYSLRMREARGEPRDLVLRRIRAAVDSVGLEPVVVAGLYDLQERLGRLIASSLRVGIGGLLLLFFVIAALASRRLSTTLVMWVCLVAVPVVTLGAFGHLGVALDLITSPAASIALAIGADSMLHLVVRARRRGTEGRAAPWAAAVAEVGPAVLSATAIVCAGFGIFALSSFPPTQRFGLAVIVGTVTAAAMAVAVLPRLALAFFGPSLDRA